MVKRKVGLVPIHIRIFADDLALLKRIAAERRTPYQTELRLLIHRALKGERRDVVLLKEQP